jgi:thiamine kinase-like enzyme
MKAKKKEGMVAKMLEAHNTTKEKKKKNRDIIIESILKLHESTEKISYL